MPRTPSPVTLPQRLRWGLLMAVAIRPMAAQVESNDSAAAPATAVVDSLRIQRLRAQWTLARPRGFEVASAVAGISPGLSIASPSGFGAQWGEGFVAAGYQNRTRFSQLPDGAVVTGIGVGDRLRTAAVELALTSFGTMRTGFAENMTMSIKAHRTIATGQGIAIGVENALRIGPIANNGGGGPDGGRSYFLAYSRLWTPETPAGKTPKDLMVTVGLGTGRFLRESDVRAGRRGVNVFASAGYRFLERWAAIADLTGQDLMLGVSAVPWRCVPAVFTVAMADVTRSAGDGPRLVAGIGLGIRSQTFTRAVHGRCLA